MKHRVHASLLSLALAASLLCATAQAQEPGSGQDPDPGTFKSCLASLKPEALKRGVSASTYDTQVARLSPDMTVLPLLEAQPEFKQAVWDYMAGLVDQERVNDGLAAMAQWRSQLDRVQAQFGVDAAVVAAVWGIESNFGHIQGGRPLLTSLSTLSCYGRRQGYFRGEFLDALKIVQDDGIAPEKLLGSWAGAFGQTQFMPSTYLRLAVGFDGNDRPNLIDSVPDALASTANYLKKAGWQTGLPWGFEVILPVGMDTSNASRRNKQPLSSWTARGVKRADGKPMPADNAMAGLMLPAGPQGPAFLVTRNFDAIYSYNASENYALAIAHLSDRLKGGGPFVTPWPTDDPGLSRAERRELQALLIGQGYDIGQPDGIIGTRTHQALQTVQQQLGLPADGRAGLKTLQALRAMPIKMPAPSAPAPQPGQSAN